MRCCGDCAAGVCSEVERFYHWDQDSGAWLIREHCKDYKVDTYFMWIKLGFLLSDKIGKNFSLR